MCEGCYGLVGVVHALNNARAIEIVDYYLLAATALALEDKLGHTGLVGLYLHAFVYITIGMAGNSDGLFPVLHHRMYGWYRYGSTEHGAVEY